MIQIKQYKLSNSLRISIWPIVLLRRRYLRWLNTRKRLRVFDYDKRRFLRYAGCFDVSARESMLAKMIMTYHILEKGLTMPIRRLDFGHSMLIDLMRQIDGFIEKWGNDQQVLHAIGTIKSYLKLHKDSGFDFSGDPEYWDQINKFCMIHADVPESSQYMFSRDDFFNDVMNDFHAFAHSRHTVRYYKERIPEGMIESAVALAMTAPSACNRQHVHVHCISNHALRDQLLSMQNGNRGFGTDADKLLVVTTCLSDIQYVEERNDPYVNAGIFIMNLCYALHYNKIACCILNWHASPETDIRARGLINIPDAETIVAVISCGIPPEHFTVAQSPRKDLDDIFVNHV